MECNCGAVRGTANLFGGLCRSIGGALERVRDCAPKRSALFSTPHRISAYRKCLSFFVPLAATTIQPPAEPSRPDASFLYLVALHRQSFERLRAGLRSAQPRYI